MKLVDPSFEILEQPDGLEGLYQHIDTCARICYQSTRGEYNNSISFVEKIIKNGHTSVLEHGTIYLYLPKSHSFVASFESNKYTMTIIDGYNVFVSTNARVLYDLNISIGEIKPFIIDSHSSYIEKPGRRVTVRFICDRAIVTEFVRHRTISPTNESTRYCNYSAGKFGNQISVISSDFDEKSMEVFLTAMEHAEMSYNKLIRLGNPPEMARKVLPLGIKSELIMTAFVEDWIWFFTLRALGKFGKPHPEAKALASALQQEFINRGYI